MECKYCQSTIVAGHLSGARSTEECVKLSEKSIRVAKRKLTAIHCDSLPAHIDGYNHVFRTLKRKGRSELIRRVGTRNIKPM